MDEATLSQLIKAHETPKRLTVSARFPTLKKPVIGVRRLGARLKNIVRYDIARERSGVFLPSITARHQSVLIRKLGDSDPELQRNKIVNLKRACEDLNGIIIRPNQVFSLWETLGEPTYRKGYVDAMLLSDGRVVQGIGGGLCQLSNFLCWIFLHAPTEIVERYHHSMDVFPDSGRTLPFGSGATCLYNFLDLKARNVWNCPLQLKIWVTDTHLKGQIRSIKPSESKFSIQENDHCFVVRGSKFYRYNEIWRTEKIAGKELSRQKVFTNFAPVMYQVNRNELTQRQFAVVDLN